MAQIRKRKNNVYQITVYLGRDEQKKKKQYYETFYGAKTEAKRRADMLESRLKRQRIGPRRDIQTIGDLLQRWLGESKESIGPQTYRTYHSRVRILNSIVGDINLYTVTNLRIKERLGSLKFNLSPRTKKNIYDTLRTALNWGATFDFVHGDLMKGIKAPKVERKNRAIYNPDELRSFIEAAKLYKHYLVIRILALSGVRVGEVLGLKWGNVNFTENKIRIANSIDTRSKIIKETKSENSIREIEMDEETMVELLKLKEKAGVQKSQKSELVFQSEDGKPLNYSSIWKTKERIIRKAGLHHIRLHDLRHGVGSILIDNGLPLTTVAAQLGQKPATTAEIYLHALRKGKSINTILYPKRDLPSE